MTTINSNHHKVVQVVVCVCVIRCFVAVGKTGLDKLEVIEGGLGREIAWCG